VGKHRGGETERTGFKAREQTQGEAIMDYENNDSVGGYAVPVDPMDMLQCDSCQ
jgi:hypothetical protein